MPAIPHTIRRGALYWWRRRFPAALAESCGSANLVLPLRTADPRRARFLATQIDALADLHLFPAFMTLQLTRSQMQEIFRKVFLAHLDKLDAIAARDKAEPGFRVEENRGSDEVMGWVYRVAEIRGAGLEEIDAEAVALMRRAGLSDAQILEVGAMFDYLRRRDLLAERPEKLANIIREVGAQPTGLNRALAQETIFRARAEANLQTGRRYDADREETQAIMSKALRDAVEESFRSAPSGGLSPSETGGSEIDRKADTVQSEPQPPMREAEPVPASFEQHPVAIWGEALIKRRLHDGIWKDKSGKQARQVYRLFARQLFEAGRHRIEDVGQKQVAELEDLFRSVAKSYGKSPSDHARSIAELRAIGASKTKEERGLEPGTKNRHFSFLGDLLDYLKSQGEPIDRTIDLSELRSRQKQRPRNARSTLAEAEIQKIFELPCYSGCAGWEKEFVFQPGPAVFHRALYFGAMLLHYQGGRREEICGLKVDDIRLLPVKTRAGTADWPCMLIDENDERGVKNVYSVRALPLHSELVRLGFMDYVARIRQLGYDLLFPDLKSPTSASPMGDRFYDEFIVGLEIAVPNARQQKKVIHSLRKSFGNFLKQRGVVGEFRADLLGHKGKSTTDEIYCDPVELGKMIGLLNRLPVVTKHLEPAPIRLVPWVEARERAPFSRQRAQARTKKRQGQPVL